MAYKYFTNQPAATFAQWHTLVYNLLLSAGWIEHDRSVGSYTVFKSGVNDPVSNLPLYVRINETSALVQCYTYWNNTSHTGPTPFSSSSSGYTIGATSVFFGYATESAFIIICLVAGVIHAYSMYAFVATEAMSNAFYTTTSSSVTTGSNKVIPVADPTNFIIGARYAILDHINGVRSSFKCVAKDGGSITADTLTGTFASGTLLGAYFFPVIAALNYNGECAVTHHYRAGTTTMTSNTEYPSYITRCAPPISTGGFPNMTLLNSYCSVHCVPESFNLADVEMIETYIHSSSYANPFYALIYGKHSGLLKTSFLNSAGYGPVDAVTNSAGDARYEGLLASGTSTGLNSNTVINDTSKSWTIDEFINKVVVITSGTGSGQISKILSNTSTSLTVASMAITVGESNYVIADKCYRTFACSNKVQVYMLEGV